MSMDNPNEYERAIEIYAVTARDEKTIKEQLATIQLQLQVAVKEREIAWRTVRTFVSAGQIKRGFYRLHTSRGMYADGILIDDNEFPDIVPMFR